MVNRTLVLLVGVMLIGAAGTAHADAYWNVTATTASGAPLNALAPGDQLILDISLTTDTPELLIIAGSVNNYDRSILQPNIGSSTLSSHLLCEFYVEALGGCLNGASNYEETLRVQTGVEGVGAEDSFLTILGSTVAEGTGHVDEPFPQFRIVYDVVGVGVTEMRIGTYADYQDVYRILDSNEQGTVHNAVVLVGIPEPGTALLLGLGLCVLTRRRG